MSWQVIKLHWRLGVFVHIVDGNLKHAQGANSAKAARAEKLLPSRLRPVAALLTKAITETYEGSLAPARLTAMSSAAAALVKVLASGGLEERVKALEEMRTL